MFRLNGGSRRRTPATDRDDARQGYGPLARDSSERETKQRDPAYLLQVRRRHGEGHRGAVVYRRGRWPDKPLNGGGRLEASGGRVDDRQCNA